MISSKTPYRIPLSGGGTDLEFYYKKFGSRFLTASISEYVYVFLLERKLDQNFMIHTTSIEFVKDINEIKHDLIRETLKFFNIKEKLQISTISTVPTATGLGTSSAMVVGLIKCISKFKNLKLSNEQIFKISYKIEREICNFPGGWQDQIVSVYGGYLDVKISTKQKFNIKKLNNKNIKNIINNHFLLVYSHIKRDSSILINHQKKNLKNKIDYYNKIKFFNVPILKYANNNNITNIGLIFEKHWFLKKKLGKYMSSNQINNIQKKIKKIDGFLGAKLIGAGGGGFFLVTVKKKKSALRSIVKQRLSYIDLKFENSGSKIIKI